MLTLLLERLDCADLSNELGKETGDWRRYVVDFFRRVSARGYFNIISMIRELTSRVKPPISGLIASILRPDKAPICIICGYARTYCMAYL